MKKRSIAAALLALVVALTLTGCVSVPTAPDEQDLDRPTAVVTLAGEPLLPTVTPDPTAATPTPAPTADPENPDASPEPVDPNVYNPLPAGSTLTLSGTHASGIVSVCYRLDGGEATVVQQPSVEVAAPDGVKKLELYVIAGNGLASQWATYYFE